MEGHKSTYCQEPKLSEQQLNELVMQNPSTNSVVCFACHQTGHYSTTCPQKRFDK